jgi:glycosyltransferase involved in cell wall biosynthesis
MKPSLCLFTASREPSGLGEHMLTLAAELQAHYRISFVCPPTPAGLPLLARAERLGLETLALDVRGTATSTMALNAWLRDRQVTIFHAHAGIIWEGHDAIYVARRAGVPAIVRTEHLPNVMLAPRHRHHRARYERLLRAVDRIICVSEEAGATFRSESELTAKLRVVRNGIDPRPVQTDRRGLRDRLDLPPDARVVLTVGRLTEQKGHRFLLDAAPAILAQEPRTYFLWVGDGPLAEALRKRARARGLEDRVRLLGQRSDVPELLAAADLFVLPSLFEGLPLAILEAMAANLPVVGTRVCGTREAIDDGVTGRLVQPGDVAALATAVLEVLTQPALAARWAVAGRARVEQEFSAARMARETAAIYAECLASCGLPSAS